MTFTSTVVYGNKHGSDIGYPTANLVVNDHVVKSLEKYGVYAVKVRFDNKEYGGALFWGKRSLFVDSKPVCEVIIIDYSGDLYGKEIQVEVSSFIRDVKDVKNDSELQKLIEQDIQKVKSNINKL